MSTSISPPVRGKAWVFQVTALCIVLGMLLALALKTQRQAAYEGMPSRVPALRAEYRILQEDNVNLQKELADYKERYEKLAKRQASGASSTEFLEQALTETKMFAGTVAVSGPGVVVTLRDSPKRDPTETRRDVVEQYIVHDYDVRGVTNELFASGAEAIAVNEQRLISFSSIRCVGAVVLVNSVQIAPPYLIKAIGRADVLEKALTLPGGVADGLFLLDMIEVKKNSYLMVPAYSGSTLFKVARQVGEKKGWQ